MRGALFSLLVLTACGRSLVFEELPVPAPGVCAVRVEPTSLDLSTDREQLVRFTNAGTTACTLGGLTVRGDRGFSVTNPPGTFTLAPAGERELEVTFRGDGAPFERNAQLQLTSNDPLRPQVEVKLAVRLPRCALEVSPAMVTFTPQRPSGIDTKNVVVRNRGTGECTLKQPTLTGDPSFAFVTAPPLSIAPGAAVQVQLRFVGPSQGPTERTGALQVSTLDGAQLKEVPLEAKVMLCELSVRPNPFDFGNVALNTTANGALTFTNVGLDTCVVSGITLMADRLFSLPVTPGVLMIPPSGGTRDVQIRFSAFDSAPPHLRTGTLRFTSNDPALRTGEVPLRGFVSTVCTEAGQYIYTIDSAGTFSRFDPANLTSTTIGTLSCMSGSSPFSMNLDQNATAWVVFGDGKLFKVDVATAACTPTSFVAGQSGFTGFGMGSLFDAMTGRDTHYISGGANDHSFATLDLTTLMVRRIGDIDAPRAELAGTGDGQLWAYAPAFATDTGNPFLDRLDPVTGATLEHHELSDIDSNGGYAIKFWGGAFYVFIGSDVWKVQRSSLVPGMLEPTSPPTKVFTRPGLQVVGAGVSTCAPVMGG
ncbi:MAG: choice-of-anchor D domain-containing protein [Myxococcaceae bacterium]|nr:choice-of-anchor D domain-containing protein [Myxococcaceae bacterium]